MGRCSEFFENFDGTPTEIFWTDDFEDEKGQEKLFRWMNNADKNGFTMTGSIHKLMKKWLKNSTMGVLRDVGLKNCHSYSVVDVREIILDNGEH